QLGRLPGANPKVRKIQRLLLGHASDIEMDGSGRILLPPMLRKHASLEKELVLVGQEKGFELWNAAAWNSCLDDALADVGELPDEIASIAF
ncbi:MAG: cell division/cell wall cluster transcriptional repressor MraZ, partial [Pseudomonadales bacterium]|nr:cell division/cell wall cluster transcriptional repressor MraZ [Pseudomonadales bacterium]